MVKPILFNTEMVRAILDGRKTVTRRLVKPQPVFFFDNGGNIHDPDNQEHIAFVAIMPDDHEEIYTPPYQPGNILYVRETFTKDGERYYFRADFESDYLEPCETLSGGYPYECTYHPGCEGCTREASRIPWRPSIHMPKDAARLFLRVADIRVERLQAITEKEALFEGIPDEFPMAPVYCPMCKGEGLVGAVHPDTLGFMEIDCPYCENAVTRFSNLWDSTIKPADLPSFGWEANPWVWVIEFERCEKPTED